MYRLRPGVKRHPEKRWALPERGFGALWIKPAPGFTGNHIIAANEDGVAFDYHGYSRVERLLAHMRSKANRWWPGWSSTLVALPAEVLVSETKSRTYDGLWLREPKQFLHDAMPRAGRYLERLVAACPSR